MNFAARPFALLAALLPGTTTALAQTPPPAATKTIPTVTRRVLPPALGPARPLSLPPVRQMTLANGLRIVVLEDHRQPAVWMRLAVPAGSVRDPKDKVGLANLTAGLLDQGTTTRSESQIADTVDSLGATLGAGAESDYLTVSANGLSAYKDTLFDLLADVALRPAFPQAEVDRLRTRTLSGIQATLADPDALATAAVNRLVYGAHPYGNFASGTPTTLAAITRDDLVAFHDANFRPQAATLFLVGDITPAEAMQKAQQYFGGWARKPIPGLAVPALLSATAAKPRITILDRPGAAQTEVRVGVLTPGYRDPNRLAGSVATAVLGLGQFDSRLSREVRVKRGLTYSVRSGIEREASAGLFSINMATKNATTGQALKIALAEADKLTRELAPAGELAARKSLLNGGFAVRVATPDGLLAQLVPAVLLGNGPSDLTERTQRIQAVTPVQVRQVVQNLGLPGAQIVLVGDRQAIEKQVAGLGTVTVVSAADLDLLSPTLKRTATAAQTPSAGGGTSNNAAPPQAASTAPAATPEELATGRALLAEIVKAHGGDAFLNLKSLVAKGKGELTPPGSGAAGFKLPAESATLTTVAPDKARVELVTAFGNIALASPGRGKTGWLDAGPLAGGVRDLPAEFNVAFVDPTALVRYVAQNNVPVRPLPDTENGKPITAAGDNKPLRGLSIPASPATGNAALRLYVETDTNLVRRIAVDTPAAPAGGAAATTRTAGGGNLAILLGNYKTVEGGLKLPGSVRLVTNGTDALSFTFDTFTVNQPVDDKVFQRPAAAAPAQ